MVLASHPEFSGWAVEVFHAFQEEEPGGDRMKTLTFGSPRDFAALQVADLVAYEVRQFALNRERGAMTMRWPMEQIRRKGSAYLAALERRLI